MRKMIFPLAVGAAFACLATAAGAAFAQDVGQTIPAETAVPYASASVGDTLRVSSVEVFQDRSPSPTRGSVVIVRYFMNDVQNITASLNGNARANDVENEEHVEPKPAGVGLELSNGLAIPL